MSNIHDINCLSILQFFKRKKICRIFFLSVFFDSFRFFCIFKFMFLCLDYLFGTHHIFCHTKAHEAIERFLNKTIDGMHQISERVLLPNYSNRLSIARKYRPDNDYIVRIHILQWTACRGFSG